MGRLRFVFRLLAIGFCLVYGMAEMFFLFPFYGKRRKLRAIQLWSRRVLASCGMRLAVYGGMPEGDGGRLLVCNHISWLDIMAVNAAFPGRFVAKDDVSKWPVVGYLATQAQTVYVSRNRGTKGNAAKIAAVADALRGGDAVTVFPEGTSTEGDGILPFKPSFFQTAFDAGVPVVPVLCRYPDENGGINRHAAYAGETSLWQSICAVVSQPSAVVELHFLDGVAADADKHVTARTVYGMLCGRLEALSKPQV